MLNKKCKVSALGGTFSFFHKGHQFLLINALKSSKELLIGITSDEFVRKLGKQHPVEPYEVRALNVLHFCLNNMSKNQRVTVFPLDDPYGPTIERADIDCIIVSEETFKRASEINELREKKGLKRLNIIKVELVRDEKGEKISSTVLWRRSSLVSPYKIR
ncbi:MAG: phosphopantetheine adenylyltransferase [Thermoprotei archaeon]|nr:MAG: phosphopantetheine adenylyltransferase [Thermoprotei archaeon]